MVFLRKKISFIKYFFLVFLIDIDLIVKLNIMLCDKFFKCE